MQGRFILFEMRWNATAMRHELVSRTVIARSSDDDAGGFTRASEMRMTDLNGDGNTDVVFYNLDFNRWEYRINPGTGGFRAARTISNWPTDSTLRRYVQLTDVTGDGHPDALIPSSNSSSTAVWRVSAWDRSLDSGNGNFGVLSTTTAQTGLLTGGANSVFGDFNGDGKLDQLQTTIDSGWVRVRRGWGRNTVTGSSTYEGVFLLRRIADGFGAWSDFSYKSLTQRSVYTRDRNGPHAGYGLGSVVYDMVPPNYVVSAVTSLAPQYALNATATGSTYAPAGTTRIEYYYTGAKVQAGGRGFLGFREIASWDPQSGMLTRTRYRQDFPFIGLPEETHTWYTPSAPWTSSEASAALGPCASCVNTAIATNGVLLERSHSTWAERATVAGLTHPYVSRSEEWNYLPGYVSGVLSSSLFTSRQVTESSSVDAYGNIGQIVSTTYTSTSGTTNMVARQTAVNTFTNNATTWHLGRLTCAVATSERTGQTTQTHRATFGYDATTGILNRETVQPTDCGTTGAQVNTTYTLDAFGNRLETTVTAAGVTGSRRSRIVYDSRGRYPLRTEAMVAGVWRTNERSEGHDAFGNPARMIAAFGNTTTGATSHHYYDAMGRPYYNYSTDGAWSRVRHGSGTPTGLSCPTGTVFHQRTDQGATGADYIIAYACKDILGREIRRAARGFDGGWV
ncbi:MAG: FG-GAP-like repeat-containing protein, partial [Wenzhouxiangellaceae bacterium]